ncbi:YcgN family cysteine cluster protein [Sandarakinorhabdus sp. DWP1-3-1]|uniref:YcgN family cysteine cluster protein n=1 Tax=Sandarakinorhabdus sp. DWP1-3-1 TaxID=2804627 RepID=UPI003CEDEF1E
MSDKPFWETVPLNRMSREQWESLCDGCGKCCVHKLEDDETGKIYPTNVACRLLDPTTAKCKDYPNRRAHVPECVRLTPAKLDTIDWLPDSCGYLRVHRGQGLAAWHPLLSGDADSVHRAGISVRGKTVSEDVVGDLESHIIEGEL